MRLNKYLSDIGYCSRREADRLIEAGKVYVDGVQAGLGVQVEEGQEVRVGKKVLTKADRPVLLALNKPRGIECTTSKTVKNNIVDFVKYPCRVYPVGRLDKDSEGLILMTNQGDLVNLDEERKAAMVSNLLVVLCGNHDAQPIVNTGSLY